jgi:hypothetical protein
MRSWAMRNADSLLARTLRMPESATHRLSMGDWDLLIRQARQAGLLARLHHDFARAGVTSQVPAPARWHFEAANTLADKQQHAVRWEVHTIQRALAPLGLPLIVLKGAAYVVAGLPAAEGRLFNDIDILVPREALGDVEGALMLAGWHATGLSAYDQRYYRRWMHEIPPLQHVQRATVIDVHHAILPDTARYHPDPAKLRSQAIPVPGMPGVMVLSATDRILHAAAHLFHDGELPHGLRDLTDLDRLLRHEATTPDFWTRLTARAAELQLERSLFYALRYARHFLDTPVPDSVDTALAHAAPGGAQRALMDVIFQRALAPMHASCADRYTPAARLAAYVRAHWLRMPPRLLLPHLFHKAFVSPSHREPKPA